MSNINKSNNGVYFYKTDYASLFRRSLVVVVDLIVLVLFAYLVSWLWSFWAESPDIEAIAEFGWLAAAIFDPEYFWVVTATAYFYLAIAKRSFLRTIGYRMVGLKIVDVKGNKPSLFQMSFRFLLLVFGPLHFFIDLFWLGGDDSRQTLRDKFVGTYVVKADAKPIGVGTIEYIRYNLLGLSLIFSEVKKNTIDEKTQPAT